MYASLSCRRLSTLRRQQHGKGRKARTHSARPSGSASPQHNGQEQLRFVPRNINEVDNLDILGFGGDLSPEHPGFHDPNYKARRVEIANLARGHRLGEPIPLVDYTEEEAAVWRSVLTRLQPLHAKHACRQYNTAMQRLQHLFEQTDSSGRVAVPQLRDVSAALQAATGWSIRPVAGLLHPRQFLAGLAFRTFHSTQYMRHVSRPDYTPEPDVIHELIGHCPMLADPEFAQLVQAIGAASLGASQEQIWHLTKVYWYTVEFGVVREASADGAGVKAFGAGILSSYGEMEHMAAEGRAALQPFDPFTPQPKMSYKDGYQQCYFVMDSFEGGTALLRKYAASIRPPAAGSS